MNEESRAKSVVPPGLPKGRQRQERPPQPPSKRAQPNKSFKPMYVVPMFSLDGAIIQKQVADMWRQLWNKIFEDGVHVHLSYRNLQDEKIIHCWNAHPRSKCHDKPNRFCLGQMDPSSDAYRDGAGKDIAEWIPVKGDEHLAEKLAEHFNG